MEIEISNLKLVQFVNDQVARGNFATPEDVINAALELRIREESPMTAENAQAIKRLKQQIARGE